MINLSIVRLQEALASEYPPGQVTIRVFDAKVILALLGVGPEPPPDEGFEPEGPGEDDWADDIRATSRVSA